MVVGEPSLMGGDYGEEDERQISRLENAQFDVAMGGPVGGMIPPHLMQPPHGMQMMHPPQRMMMGPGGPMPPHG